MSSGVRRSLAPTSIATRRPSRAAQANALTVVPSWIATVTPNFLPRGGLECPYHSRSAAARSGAIRSSDSNSERRPRQASSGGSTRRSTGGDGIDSTRGRPALSDAFRWNWLSGGTSITASPRSVAVQLILRPAARLFSAAYSASIAARGDGGLRGDRCGFAMLPCPARPGPGTQASAAATASMSTRARGGIHNVVPAANRRAARRGEYDKRRVSFTRSGRRAAARRG